MKHYQVWYYGVDDAVCWEEFDTLATAKAFNPFRMEVIAITELAPTAKHGCACGLCNVNTPCNARHACCGMHW